MSPDIDPATPAPDRLRSPVAAVGRKLGVAVLGGLVLLAGVVMLVTPGPGIVTIVLGLSLLGREYPLARRLVARIKAAARLKSSPTGRP